MSNMDVSCKHADTIKLVKMNDIAYVWNSEDWLTLRNLRIMGSFVGNLAAMSKQDRMAALPLALLNEEATLLLEKGIATLNSLPSLLDPPTEDLRRKCKDYREKVFSDQAEILKNERKSEIREKIDIIVQGKLAKTRCNKNLHPLLDKEEILQKEYSKFEDTNEKTLAIHIPTRDPWIEEKDFEECSWMHFPRNHNRYLVYKDLWERGYYVTQGEKFGGDYLAYPGDPVKFHAFFVIICMDKNKKLKMQDIVMYGRLGQSVKKTIVLSYLDNKGQVTYHSVQWAGF